MKISFICNPVYINGGWSPWDTRIGGSEECIVQWSKRLAKNHDVQVFHNGKHGVYEGVAYRDHSEFEPGDVTINMNYPEFKSSAPTVFLSSLTQHPDLSHFKAVCAISQYQIDNCGLSSYNPVILPPGYESDVIKPGKKIPKQCFYASSPDRGLTHLLEAWPIVHEQHPDATLIVTYGGELDLPGVINLGTVDEDTMNEIYETSDVWCHPCNGGELYCMTGIKAQASECVPVVIPTMALAETVRHGVFATKEDYAEILTNVLGNEPLKEEIRAKLRQETYPDWESTAQTLEKIALNVL